MAFGNAFFFFHLRIPLPQAGQKIPHRYGALKCKFESQLYSFISEIVEGKKHEGHLSAHCRLLQRASRISVLRWDFWSWKFLNFDHNCITALHPWGKQEGDSSLARDLYAKGCPKPLSRQAHLPWMQLACKHGLGHGQGALFQIFGRLSLSPVGEPAPGMPGQPVHWHPPVVQEASGRQ